jgi:hypothetical protein
VPLKSSWLPREDCSTARYFNQSQLIGFLARDPKYYDFVKVAPYCVITLGVRTKIGKDRVLLDWHNVVIWAPVFIELITKYVRKGDWVQVIGHLRNRPFFVGPGKWTTRQRIEVGSDGKFLLMAVPKLFRDDIREMRVKQELGEVTLEERMELAAVVNASHDEFIKANDNREDLPDGPPPAE